MKVFNDDLRRDCLFKVYINKAADQIKYYVDEYIPLMSVKGQRTTNLRYLDSEKNFPGRDEIRISKFLLIRNWPYMV